MTRVEAEELYLTLRSRHSDETLREVMLSMVRYWKGHPKDHAQAIQFFKEKLDAD